ncbi:chemotaxis protein CheW [Inhella crocodyli]|uniref:Chemotaxis protein CheW n=1 Tax=Inhella crocodyli TaxID=2499851 RepID=A0A3S2UGP3_9BURK|nr:chemotaxis protein CheW [Inhella crocodyli]RVT87564.1 purine-binding chemotaxis protein CheW [Inhella crocodyli]
MNHAPDEHPDTGETERQFVTFELAGERFAVPMGPVQEIIRLPEVARLPLAPPALEGLANLRGRVLPILSLRRVLGLPLVPHDDGTRALIIHLGQSLGFIVDRVSSVITTEPGDLHPAQSLRSVVRTECLTGMIRRRDATGAEQLYLVLDFERLTREEFQLQIVASAAGSNAGGDRPSGAMELEPARATDEIAEEATSGSADLRLVSFTVSHQEYGIPIADVQEIVQVPEVITAVPQAPRHVSGVISLRERLLPLVDLRSLFDLPPEGQLDHRRIVVVALPGCGPVGLITDTVKEVLSVSGEAVDSMPGLLARDPQLQEFESICRLDEGRRLVTVLSSERLLTLEAVRDAAACVDNATLNAEDTTVTAHPTDAIANAENEDLQVVIFRLADEEFGVPIMSVQEIVRVPEQLTRVPKTPPFVEGVINLRGAVLPVIDQRRRLGLPVIDRNDRQRIMVFTQGNSRTGFIVDSVAEVLRLPRACIAAAPAMSEAQQRLIRQVARLDGDRRLVMIVDPVQLLQLDAAPAADGAPGDGPMPLAA